MSIIDFLLGKKETNSSKIALDGEVAIKLGKYKQAIKYFDNAIELEPGNDMYYYSRSKAQKELRNYKEALKDIEKSISINPKVNAYHKQKKDIELLVK